MYSLKRVFERITVENYFVIIPSKQNDRNSFLISTFQFFLSENVSTWAKRNITMVAYLAVFNYPELFVCSKSHTIGCN